MSDPRILVAGVGNVFLGDDGFGVEVVRRLAMHTPLPGVRVTDFGIRGMDLAYTLMDPYDLVVLVDVVRKGGAPGTLYLLEIPDGAGDPAAFEAHGMVPSQALRTARAMGGVIPNAVVVGCEPESFGAPGLGRMGLSPVVEEAVGEAVRMVESVVSKHAGARTHA